MPGTQTAPAAGKTATFKIHSNGAVKAVVRKDAITGEDQYYVEGIASSNVRDRHGDTITAQAQASMLEQAKGLTMFLNHSYDVPEDVFGTCEESSLEAAGDIVDLVIRAKVAKSNPRAMKSWQLIKNDEITLGFSIGGNLTEYDVDEENDDGTSWCPPLIINGIELFEISLCGVPANPRSYTRDFVSQISRGFMRSAARSPEVRELVRKTLIKNGAPDVDLAKTIDDAVAADSVTTQTVTLSLPDGFDAETFRKTYEDALREQKLFVCGDKGKVAAYIATADELFAGLDEKKAALEELNAQADAVRAALEAAGAETETVRAQLADLNGQLQNKVSERDALVKEIETLSAQRDEIRGETETLVNALAELKATPTGRQSKTATSGGSSGNGTAPNVDLTKMTAAELLDYKRKLQNGSFQTDARFG